MYFEKQMSKHLKSHFPDQNALKPQNSNQKNNKLTHCGSNEEKACRYEGGNAWGQYLAENMGDLPAIWQFCL